MLQHKNPVIIIILLIMAFITLGPVVERKAAITITKEVEKLKEGRK